MSKKDLDFDKLSSLKPKKTKAKADPEHAVKSIHTKTSEKEKVKRITIDLPFSVYVALQLLALSRRKAQCSSIFRNIQLAVATVQPSPIVGHMPRRKGE